MSAGSPWFSFFPCTCSVKTRNEYSSSVGPLDLGHVERDTTNQSCPGDRERKAGLWECASWKQAG